MQRPAGAPSRRIWFLRMSVLTAADQVIMGGWGHPAEVVMSGWWDPAAQVVMRGGSRPLAQVMMVGWT
jgi:hypothetical protein